MKKYIIFSIFFSILLICSCNTSKNSVAEKQRVADMVNRLISAQDYTIDVNQAAPIRGKVINLSYGYSLTVRNDSAFAYLPYYGVATIAPYNPAEGGIKFSELMQEYTIQPTGKNDGWDITFKVNPTGYNYQIRISIFNNGRSTLYINSYQRDAINFYGSVKPED